VTNGPFAVGEAVQVLWNERDLVDGTITMAVPHELRYLVAFSVNDRVYESAFRDSDIRKVT
jgi:hypothetical protein